jgi:small-conductance mechanosensitive channel
MTGEPVRHGRARPQPRQPELQTPELQTPELQTPEPQAPAPQAPAQQVSSVRRLCAIVLIMETVVIWLSIPVALAVNRASPSRIGVAGVILAIAAVALAALARRRPRWTIIGGSVLQVLVIAAGVIVPVMYFLGAIFAALWVIGIGLGRRLDATP